VKGISYQKFADLSLAYPSLEGTYLNTVDCYTTDLAELFQLVSKRLKKLCILHIFIKLSGNTVVVPVFLMYD